MKTQSVIAGFTLLLAANATPLPSNMSPRLIKAYDIRWCKKEKFSDCATSLELDVKKCYNLRGSSDNNAESMRKGGGVACQLYDEKDCQGAFLQANGDMKSFPSEWKNKISSFKCDDKDGD